MGDYSFWGCCDLCGDRSEVTFDIFGDKGLSVNAPVILEKYFWFEITKTTKPKIICQDCWICVENFHNLYLRVELTFRKVNKIGEFSLNSHFIDMKDVGPYLTHYDIKQEPKTSDQEDNAVAEKSDEYVEAVEKTVNDQKQHIDLDSDFDREDNNDEDHDDDSDEYEEDTSAIEIEMDKKPPNITEVDDICNNKDTEDKTRPIKTEKSEKHDKKAYLYKPPGPQTIKVRKDNAFIAKYVNMFCDICQEPFKTFAEGRRHFRLAHKRKSYVVCCFTRKFHNLKAAVEHCNWHVNPNLFRCKECGKSFQNADGLRLHMDTHGNAAVAESEGSLFKCNLCPKTFVNENVFNNHQYRDHMIEEVKKFECDICKKRFLFLSHIKVHIKRVHEDAHAKICEICSKYFKTKKAYEMHYISEHTDINRSVQCEICGNWLKHLNSLRKHMERHIETNIACEFCGEIKANKTVLKSHIYNKHSERTYPCTLCDKTFRRTRSLREHMAMHNGVNPYQCPHCPLDFRTQLLFYSHRKKEHPDKHAESLLLRPKNIKTMGIIFETNVTCEQCGEVKPNKAALRSHIYNKHSSQLHPCTLCKKVLRTARNLKKHMQWHENTVFLRCSLCPNEFRFQKTLQSHMKNEHGIDQTSGTRWKSQPPPQQQPPLPSLPTPQLQINLQHQQQHPQHLQLQQHHLQQQLQLHHHHHQQQQQDSQQQSSTSKNIPLTPFSTLDLRTCNF